MSAQTEALSALVAPVVQRAGLVLEQLSVSSAGRSRLLRLVVDLPADRLEAVDLDTVAEVSRAVSDVLDRADTLPGGSYTLEVTSPGVDRPLVHPRHWLRARGRLVRVALRPSGRSAGVLRGRLVEVDDDGVGLEPVPGSGAPPRAGARRGGRSPSAVVRLPWDDVLRGRVEVEFSRADPHDDDPDDVDPHAHDPHAHDPHAHGATPSPAGED